MTTIPTPAPVSSRPAGQSLAARIACYTPELWTAAVAFVVYPAMRPFSSETGRAGALAFASPRWVIAHSVAIAGFILLGLGLQRFTETLTRARARARTGMTLTWIGLGLTLPYYGAEVFGLHAVGQQALASGNWTQFAHLVSGVRWHAGLWFILLGLLSWAAGVIMVSAAAWREPARPRWVMLPLAVAVALYIPQFATSQPFRVAHGALMAVGCILLAASLRPVPADRS